MAIVGAEMSHFFILIHVFAGVNIESSLKREKDRRRPG